MQNRFENEVGFLIMALLIIGQCTVGERFFFGQIIYLVANVLNVLRDFVLKRPLADKVKDVCFCTITIGLILIRILS